MLLWTHLFKFCLVPCQEGCSLQCTHVFFEDEILERILSRCTEQIAPIRPVVRLQTFMILSEQHQCLDVAVKLMQGGKDFVIFLFLKHYEMFHLWRTHTDISGDHARIQSREDGLLGPRTLQVEQRRVKLLRSRRRVSALPVRHQH